jgi:hypothetical protein
MYFAGVSVHRIKDITKAYCVSHANATDMAEAQEGKVTVS